VTMYMPSCRATISRSPMAAIFPQMREAMPNGEYLRIDQWSYLEVSYGFLVRL